LAAESARELGHARVGVPHILVGLMRERLGIAAQVLTDEGLAEERAYEFARHSGAQEQPTTRPARPRLTSLAPQRLAEHLARSLRYYQAIGFTFGDAWEGFYAIGTLDGLELHLKEAPNNEAERQLRREHEHLDAAAGVDGIEAFYEHCVSNGVTILKP